MYLRFHLLTFFLHLSLWVWQDPLYLCSSHPFIIEEKSFMHACLTYLIISRQLHLFFFFSIFSSKWLRSGFSLCLQNVHQGYPVDTYMRFLKAREGNVSKAHNMVRSTSVLPFQISFLVTSDHSLFLVLLSLWYVSWWIVWNGEFKMKLMIYWR